MSQRIQKVNELIKRELSQIILKEVDFSSGVLVTLTRVESSVDLRNAKVFVSVFPEKNTGEVFRNLNKELYDLQQKLNKRLNMRPIPRIRFINEKEVIKAARIGKLLEEIKNK